MLDLNFIPQGYCDDAIVVYLTKPPICKLTLTPRSQGPNINIAWDISGSRAPTGTIDTFDISWGGTTDIGNLVGQDWAVDPKTGNVQFLFPGRYYVRATVTDTLGVRSQPCILVVTVLEGIIPTINTYIFAASDIDGIFLLLGGAATDLTVALSTNHKKIRDLTINPLNAQSPLNQINLAASTAAGVIITPNGGTTWTTVSKAQLGDPVNTAGDLITPVTADLDQSSIRYSANGNQIWLMRETATRFWSYLSEDNGATWTNFQVANSGAGGF